MSINKYGITNRNLPTDPKYCACGRMIEMDVLLFTRNAKTCSYCSLAAADAKRKANCKKTHERQKVRRERLLKMMKAREENV